MNNQPCPICRELHATDRGLTFDGFGINGCDLYRSRLATLTHYAPKELGPVFSAAPELVAALNTLLARCASLDQSATRDGLLNADAIAQARAALNKVQP